MVLMKAGVYFGRHALLAIDESREGLARRAQPVGGFLHGQSLAGFFAQAFQGCADEFARMGGVEEGHKSQG